MIFERAISRHTSAPALLKSLDASALRGKAIANNIANATTPGYNRIEVRFEDDLRRALDPRKLAGVKTDLQHMEIGRPTLASVKPEAYRPDDPTLPGDINNVDVDMEMAKLAENQLLYQSGVKFLNERTAVIRAAITGRVS